MIPQNQILTRVISEIQKTEIVNLTGGIYKKTRPTDSFLEDCTVNLITGGIGKFIQDGSLRVHLFYMDINILDTYYEDSNKAQIFENLLFNLSELLLLANIGVYFFENTREIYTSKIEDIHQHFAILKIDYKIV